MNKGIQLKWELANYIPNIYKCIDFVFSQSTSSLQIVSWLYVRQSVLSLQHMQHHHCAIIHIQKILKMIQLAV